MSGSRGILSIVIAAALTAGCSHAGSVSKVATDYNRAFSDARNEQLLLNILRAAAREPLMFSAPSEVNATVNRTVGVDTLASNLITGGRDMISPTLKLSGSTVPLVKITPQSHKEFTEGLLQPITPERLHLFLSQGWNADFLLPLIVEEYRCPGGNMIENDGENTAQLGKLAESGRNFDLQREVVKGPLVTLVVPNERALEMLGSEMAGGYKVAAIRPVGAPLPPAPNSPEPALASAQVNVTLSAPEKASWTADMGDLCGQEGRKAVSFTADSTADPAQAGYLKLRSVEGIIYFLGEAMRPCVVRGQAQCRIDYSDSKDSRSGDDQSELFRIHASEGPVGAAAVSARFHGRSFTIPRLDEADTDRTLKTLSFLSQLIALQTSAVALSPTIIGLPQ